MKSFERKKERKKEDENKWSHLKERKRMKINDVVWKKEREKEDENKWSHLKERKKEREWK